MLSMNYDHKMENYDLFIIKRIYTMDNKTKFKDEISLAN